MEIGVILILALIGIAIYLAVSKPNPPPRVKQKDESGAHPVSESAAPNEILLELRALREETAKVKWAVRGVGFLIALIVLFGFALTQK